MSFPYLCNVVPSRKVEKYLKSKGAMVLDANVADKKHFSCQYSVAKATEIGR